ncbi:23S rRNA pseudouridine2604 synthase [Bacillus sp. OV322]|uniref:pseudouridine synthase n=1 Tax=Bacillus sp. OV322 TaxID=1882764 RepID=UPI0008DF8FEB|nr:pseudouridine synthase [Bacillus sp. OV322]SFC92016.1 23S rRNA pseudouridine2604 synthase [Bacillus sp. OV322]
MRINKYISETGYCSRRETDRLIMAGRITVNGLVCMKDTLVEYNDDILIDGKPIPCKKEHVYLMLNKPAGITCTAAKHVEGNIIDFIHFPERIFPVGRLDKDSVGLILLTNDGDIVNKIMHSENMHEKEYIVTVDRPITNAFIEKMSDGVEILDTVTKRCDVQKVNEFMFRIILTQGLNRQIRRMCKELGYKVEKLERVRIMNILLNELERGQWRNLTEEELTLLFLQLS